MANICRPERDSLLGKYCQKLFSFGMALCANATNMPCKMCLLMPYGIVVMGTTKYFLIRFKACHTQGIHVWYASQGKTPGEIAGCTVQSNAVLLNGRDVLVKLPVACSFLSMPTDFCCCVLCSWRKAYFYSEYCLLLSLITGQTLRISICCHGIETHSQKRTVCMCMCAHALLTSPRLRKYHKTVRGARESRKNPRAEGCSIVVKLFSLDLT